MNQSVPLYIVLIVLAGAGVAYLIYLLTQAIVSAGRILSALDATACRVEAALATTSAGVSRAGDALMPAAEALRANMGAVPSLLEAVAKVGQAQLEVQQRMQQESEQKKKNPFGRANGPSAPRDINAANEEYEVSMMMRAEGITREEAMLRRNPANQNSVWDGGQIFENWSR
jgi:hypothetical protein